MMRGAPQKPDPNIPGAEVPIRVTMEPMSAEAPEIAEPLRDKRNARRLKLTARLFMKCGYSENCEGCARARAGSVIGRWHTKACRKIIEEELEKDEEERGVLMRDGERVQRKRGRKEVEEDAGSIDKRGKMEQQGSGYDKGLNAEEYIEEVLRDPAEKAESRATKVKGDLRSKWRRRQRSVTRNSDNR